MAAPWSDAEPLKAQHVVTHPLLITQYFTKIRKRQIIWRTEWWCWEPGNLINLFIVYFAPKPKRHIDSELLLCRCSTGSFLPHETTQKLKNFVIWMLPAIPDRAISSLLKPIWLIPGIYLNACALVSWNVKWMKNENALLISFSVLFYSLLNCRVKKYLKRTIWKRCIKFFSSYAKKSLVWYILYRNYY